MYICAVYGKSCRISNEADHDIKREHQDHLVSLPGFWEPWLDRTLFQRWRFHCSAAFHFDLNTWDSEKVSIGMEQKWFYLWVFIAFARVWYCKNEIDFEYFKGILKYSKFSVEWKKWKMSIPIRRIWKAKYYFKV